MSNYELGIAYELYLFEESIDQSLLEVKTNEAVLLLTEYATHKNFQLIQEGFKDKMKSTFEKLITMIKNLWEKFARNVNSLIKSDKEYLVKYKKTIFDNPLKDDKYIMYPYMDGENELKNSKIPAFNLTSIQNKTEEDIVKMINPKYYDKEKKATDIARHVFRGNSDKEIEIPSSKISLIDIYNYCISYDKVYKSIETDMKQVQRASNEAIMQINKIPNNVSENAIYSFFKEEMLYEADDNKDTGGPSVTKASDDKPKEDKSNVKGEHDTKNVPSEVKDKAADIEVIKVYLRVCYGFLGVKMSVAEEMYNAYMYILRDHIKMNTGTEGKKEEPNTNTPAKKSDEGSKDNDEKDDVKNPSITDKPVNLFDNINKKSKDKKKNKGNKK